jgi:xanthine dehydrogenase accessory factor
LRAGPRATIITTMNYEIFATLDELRRSGRTFVLVTVVEAAGSVPGRPGTRMAVLADDSFGTVGGGRLEDAALEHARQLLRDRRSEVVHYNLTDLKMTCGGRATLQYEYVEAARRLYVFGGGHVGAALAAMARGAGFLTTVFDDRTDLSWEGRFPAGVKFVLGPYEDAGRHIPPGSYLVFVTHGHKWDEDAVKSLGPEGLAKMKYVGVIGSRSKARAMLRSLEKAGIEPGPNFYMPIGVKIGGNTPGDIAISILAEMVAAAHGTEGLPHLRLTGEAQENGD